MKLQKKLTVLMSVSMVVLLVVSPRALAGPTSPSVSGPEADFTGNQSDGIWPDSFWTCPPVDTYNVYDLTTDITPADNFPGIQIACQGENGETGPGTWTIFSTSGGQGTPGGLGGEIVGVHPPDLTLLSPEVNFTGGDYEIITSGFLAFGIGAISAGGDGGNGGSPIWHLLAAYGGDGGAGGWALPVIVTSNGSIHTDGERSSGIYAVSQGGDGGNGGSASSVADARGGDGGAGGRSATVTVTSDGGIQTDGFISPGIYAVSKGGDGSNGGSASSAAYAEGLDGGTGGDSGSVTVTNNGSIHTDGERSSGIYALSQGGDGGNAELTVAWAGDGGPGNSSDTVTIYNYGNIETTGDYSEGIVGRSLGGAGGNGGYANGLLAGYSGSALGSGSGGAVEIENTGDIMTSGIDSRGIFAQSFGGFAGDAGVGGGILFGWEGSANSAGDGGVVTVTNSGAITTMGNSSEEYIGAAIFTESIGGGGGDAGTAGGFIVLGGSGSAGGHGGIVQVTNGGKLQTSGNDTYGIVAQSIGGGGGSGGISAAFITIGGSGKSSGDGGGVTVVNDGQITTEGDRSSSIIAQSIGGGGGILTAHGGLDVSFVGSIGGFGESDGGAGGSGGVVSVTNSGNLETSGDDSSGILAHSIGGGGGHGGWSFGFAEDDESLIGGEGGDGGHGGQVDVSSVDASIITEGTFSHGIHAMSVGGGGGSGREVNRDIIATVASTLSAIGGRGGGGGDGNVINLTSNR